MNGAIELITMRIRFLKNQIDRHRSYIQSAKLRGVQSSSLISESTILANESEIEFLEIILRRLNERC